MELQKVMKRVELFRGLNDNQLKRLADISQRESYGQGQVICRQGEPGDRMFVVAEGQVEIKLEDQAGASRSAVYLGEGQVVGEMALIDRGNRSATVVAVQDNTIVYSIPDRDFAALCQSDTAIGYVMMRNIAQDLSFKLRHRDSK